MSKTKKEALRILDLKSKVNFPNEILPITIDQLRTYLAVCREASPRRGGQSLGREQTSVEKQLKTLQDRFERLAQGKLILRPAKRGAGIELTEAGERVKQFAEVVLDALANLSTDIRALQHDRPIRIALTTFMISVLAEIQPSVTKAFGKVGIKLNRELVHCRSNHIQSILLHKEVDFSLGGFVAREGEKAPVLDGLEFVEWKREGLGLLSSFHIEGRSVRRRDLLEKRIPLIVPRQGLIHDLLDLWFEGEDLDRNLNVVEWCDDVHFGLDLLYRKVYDASMISTNYITKWIKERPNSDHLRFHEIVDSGCELRVGLFRRKEIGKAYNRSHPITIFWEVFKQLASEESTHQRHVE